MPQTKEMKNVKRKIKRWEQERNKAIQEQDEKRLDKVREKLHEARNEIFGLECNELTIANVKYEVLTVGDFFIDELSEDNRKVRIVRKNQPDVEEIYKLTEEPHTFGKVIRYLDFWWALESSRILTEEDIGGQNKRLEEKKQREHVEKEKESKTTLSGVLFTPTDQYEVTHQIKVGSGKTIAQKIETPTTKKKKKPKEPVKVGKPKKSDRWQDKAGWVGKRAYEIKKEKSCSLSDGYKYAKEEYEVINPLKSRVIKDEKKSWIGKRAYSIREETNCSHEEAYILAAKDWDKKNTEHVG